MARTYSKLLVPVIACCLLTACEENNNPNANKVTVNPPAGANSKESKQNGVDVSPMDISYFPVDYPVLKMQHKDIEPLTARVIYSRPQKNGRNIFGSLIEYGKIWRLGANECNEIEFFKDVTIQQKKIPRGRYMMYCVPYADKWNIRLNSDLNSWGLQIDSSKDLFKFDIPVAKTNYPYEYFTMEFEPAEPGLQLAMMWDSVRAVLPIRN